MRAPAIALGLTLLLGLPGTTTAQAAWVQEAKLLAPDGVNNADFGWSVAVSGATALVGAPRHLDRGAAFLYVREAGGWRHEATLRSEGLPLLAGFGQSVALAGSLALVGAPGEPYGGEHSGAAYVFECDTRGQWVLRERIVSAVSGFSDSFPYSIALRGDTALLTGQTGFVTPGRIYREQPSGWTETGGIGVTDPGVVESCALTGDFALLGSARDWPLPFENAGAVHLFGRLPGGAFSPQVTLEADDARFGLRFGSAVALSGTTAFVGAEGDDTDGASAGAAYAFAREANGTWVQTQKVRPEGGGPYAHFGASASASNGRFAVGAPHRFSSDTGPGSVHLFEWEAGAGWVEAARLVAGEPGDEFGSSLALQCDTLVAGAPRDEDNGPRAGAAYVFRRQAVARATARGR